MDRLNEIPRMSAIPDLGFSSALFALLGIINGGLKQSSANATKDTVTLMKMITTANRGHKFRLMRESIKFSKNRHERVINGLYYGGARCAMVGAGFSAMQTWLAEKRGVHDLYNIVAASSASGAAYWLMKPGSLISRGSNALLGAVGAGLVSLPYGWIHLKLDEMLNKRRTVYMKEIEAAIVETNAVVAAIEKLERKTRK